MICSNCGGVVEKGQRFCVFCGKPTLNQQKQSIQAVSQTQANQGEFNPQPIQSVDQPPLTQPKSQSQLQFQQQAYQESTPQQAHYAPVQQHFSQQSYDVDISNISDKSRTAIALLAFFLGVFGIHRFYAGKIGSGTAMLIMTIIGAFTSVIIIGLFLIAASGIWAFVDFIIALTGTFTDGEGRYVKN